VRPNEKRIQPNLQPAAAASESSAAQFNIPKHIRLTAEITVMVLAVVIPLSVQAGLFPSIFAKPASTVPVTTVQYTPTISAVDVALLSAQQHPNPLSGRGGAELVVENDALVSTGPVGKDELAEKTVSTGEIRVYTVRVGDSLSQIAEMFDVTTNTIMWANDLTKASAIQPGDTLVILPIAGVRHVVKSGDTIAAIAKKYEGDLEEILSFNQLDEATGLTVGDTLIIPGGALHAAPARVAASASPVRVSGATGGEGSGFSHPAPGAVKTQGIHGYNAVDLAGSNGTAIRAAAAGEVIVAKSSGWNGGYGNYIVIKHANGAQTLYAHLSSLSVGVGAYVSQAETIGGMGSTGRSTGTHLHFEVRGARNPF
jgi:murein DD-endopeptidase MepM/ murein hydrolase activator NlpD